MYIEAGSCSYSIDLSCGGLVYKLWTILEIICICFLIFIFSWFSSSNLTFVKFKSFLGAIVLSGKHKIRQLTSLTVDTFDN